MAFFNLNSSIHLSRSLGVAALCVSAVALSACSSSVKLDDKSANIESRTGDKNGTLSGQQGGSTASGTGSNNPIATSTIATVEAGDPLKDANSPLSKRSIYFDYDSFVLKDEFRTTVEAHAKYLNADKRRKVVVQGNTDERGSREYNLALGQKRAEVVRKSLMTLGVADAQIEAVSFGEEKPKSGGADDTAFAENRRADLAY